MPRKAPQKAQAATATASRSDDEILRGRRIVESFETADFVLKVLGWSLLGLMLAWVLNLDATASELGPSLHAGITDPKVCLVACAQFSTGIASSSPKGAWSSWRQTWQAAWSIPLLMIGVSLFITTGVAVSFDGMLAAGCCVGALVMLLTTPGSTPPRSGRGSTAVLGRAMIIVDGLVGIIVGIGLLVRIPDFSAGAVLALAVTCGPLFMTCTGLLLCTSQTEVQEAARCVLTHTLGATIQCWWIADNTGLLIAMATWLMHATLYLPLPWKDPDENPFHSSLRKTLRGWVAIFNQPVSGFSHENE